jgi:hypothetical protein
MANIQKTFSFVNGQPADATQVNKNFDDLITGVGDLTLKKTDNVSATDKVLGRVTAGAGTIEEIACTAAGRAILDDASAAAQIATLGLDADLTTLSLPASTTITAAGAELINDANAAAQLTTLGITAAAQTVLDDTTVAAMRTTLGASASTDSGSLCLASDLATSSTDLVSTNLTFPIAASEVWSADIYGLGKQQSGSATFSFAIAAPSGCGVSGDLGNALLTAINTAVTSGITSTTGVPFSGHFRVVNSSTAGNVTFQVKSSGGANSACTVLAGTTMNYRKATQV